MLMILRQRSWVDNVAPIGCWLSFIDVYNTDNARSSCLDDNATGLVEFVLVSVSPSFDKGVSARRAGNLH